MRWAILLVILHCLPVLRSAQESPRALLPRSVTVTAGVGNAMSGSLRTKGNNALAAATTVSAPRSSGRG
jgi:hypothetical protein